MSIVSRANCLRDLSIPALWLCDTKSTIAAIGFADLEIPFPYRTLAFGDDGLKKIQASDQRLITSNFKTHILNRYDDTNPHCSNN